MPYQPPFQRILIANRGEIAIRIARAATELGIRTIGIYSHEDRFALHRFKTDESYKVGIKGQPLSGYLNVEEIVELAKKIKADAIHPGYGFLSESSEFAEHCSKNGIVFIGPSSEILQAFGDKVAARRTAIEAGLQVVPGTKHPLKDFHEAKEIAQQMGYPVTLKAISGGGGKGIRMIEAESELEHAFQRSSSEAKSNFGKAELYLEKKVISPRHIEVQILGDQSGHIVHLFERDCSIQRRHQKVVEVAPALGLSESTRASIREQAVKLAKHVGYVGIGTIEFLVDKNEVSYFLEVNPRVQVEHTVTEMITGIDLIQASILVAAGCKLADEKIGIKSQECVKVNGAAIQCRITTEDPLNNFAPDTGRIIAYRPAAGFGIRLDGGHGTSGGVVTPYYDSLLVKVTAFAKNLQQAAAKMHRSLSEFRIRGVRHNIPLLKNIVMHPAFLESNIDTTFLEKYNELYEYPRAKDRATKVLAYIANVTVNDPHNLGKQRFRAVSDAPNLKDNSKQYEKYILAPNTPTAKKIFDQSGPSGLTQWLRNHKPTLLTDTTMRDAHQSLFATRLRTRDMLKAADFYKNYAQHFFSLEVWGGATFDTCLRFLKEDPWERLATIREAIPNVLLQMLLRGDNAVGYSNYPSWVVREFIKETVRHGLEVFRIFDCLNQPDKMQIAVDEVKKQGAIAEISLCYTGNITDLKKCKYDLKYYLDIAKELEAMGADILCVKDMAGLLRPSAAKLLITALKDTVSLPIHLHTHDTSGVGVSMQIEAAKAGCDIIDGAVSSMSGLTSQPSLNALIAALEDSDIAPEVPLPVVDRLARYWEQVRTMYQAFDPGIKSTSTDVYDHEIPGGQYSNLFNQAMKVGLSADDFYELTQRYAEVNTLFGDIIKVTPSSKVVGDMALLLQKQGLTGPSYLQEKPALDYPDSVVSFFKGHMGEPYGGFPEEVRTLVLGENAPPPEAIEVSSDDSLDSIKEFLLNQRGNSDQEITNAQALSYRLYPKVYQEFQNHQKQYGEASGLTTPVFFYGMQQGEEIETDLEPGKTLVISMQGMSQTDENGMRKVFFNLNGFSRQIEVVDQSSESALKKRPTAEANNELHIGAAMPGKVLEVRVTAGTHVKQGDIVLITESMKMEYTITAKTSGIVKSIYVQQLDQVESGDLLVELENAPA